MNILFNILRQVSDTLSGKASLFVILTAVVTFFFRLFFNSLKAATMGADAPVDRMYISGVSPLTLSDVASGFNIGENLSNGV